MFKRIMYEYLKNKQINENNSKNKKRKNLQKFQRFITIFSL